MMVLPLILLILLFSGNVNAQEESQQFKKYEITIGLGIAASPEEDIFNLQHDAKVSPDLAINLAFTQNLSEHLSLGGHIFGYTETTEKFDLLDEDGNLFSTEFELNTFNFGAHVRYLFSTGNFQPYGKLCLNLASGEISSKKTGDLRYNGASFTAALGIRLIAGEHFAFSLEALGSLGFASWSEKPFTNSRNDEFNPAMSSLLLNLTYLLG